MTQRLPSETAGSEQARAAFDHAIATGRLSADDNADNAAAGFMFMGFDEDTGKALFKNRDTRRYID